VYSPRLPVPGSEKTKAKKAPTTQKLALDRKRLQVAMSVAMQKVAEQAPPPAEVTSRISAADLAAVSKRVAKEMMPMFDAKINAAMQKAIKEGVKSARLLLDVKLLVDGVAKKVNEAIEKSPAAQISLPGMKPLLQQTLGPLREAAHETMNWAANTKTVANVLEQYVAQHLISLGVKLDTMIALVRQLDER
jgi:predicted DNA binding CopG/RHH family protein